MTKLLNKEKKYAKKFNSLDKLISYLRIAHIAKYIPKDSKVIDIGSGYIPQNLLAISNNISEGLAIDYEIDNSKKYENIKTLECDIENYNFNNLPKFDIAICLAVIEHVNNPIALLKNIYKCLNNNSILLLTTPSWKAKPILEFLAFKLGIIEKASILDHKRYFNKDKIISACTEAGFKDIKHAYFQFGLNNFVLAKK